MTEPAATPAFSRTQTTITVCRGVCRVLRAHGLAPLLEAPLANGRRADIMALRPSGEIWIVETKSCLADFTVDQKWADYLPFCDRFFFGVDECFPRERLPLETGLIVADGFDGEILREPPCQPLAAPRRKALTLMFARLAADRLTRLAET